MCAKTNRIAPDAPPSSEQLLAEALQRARKATFLLVEKNELVTKLEQENNTLRRTVRELRTLHADAESIAPLPATEYARVTRDNERLRNEAAHFRAAVHVVRETVEAMFRLEFASPDYRMDVTGLMGKISRATQQWNPTCCGPFLAVIDDQTEAEAEAAEGEAD